MNTATRPTNAIEARHVQNAKIHSTMPDHLIWVKKQQREKRTISVLVLEKKERGLRLYRGEKRRKTRMRRWRMKRGCEVRVKASLRVRVRVKVRVRLDLKLEKG